MRLVKNIIVVLLFMVLVLVIFNFLTSNGYAEITDLIHKDTEKLIIEEGYDFSDSELNKYQVNEILFIPYTRHNPFESYDEEFYSYSLRLASYKPKENDNKVMINYVTVEGINDVEFDKITKTLNRKLEFIGHEKNSEVQIDEFILIDEINNYNMELNDNSQIKVVLNVSVEENEKIVTRDLVYKFETRVRKYLVQR